VDIIIIIRKVTNARASIAMGLDRGHCHQCSPIDESSQVVFICWRLCTNAIRSTYI